MKILFTILIIVLSLFVILLLIALYIYLKIKLMLKKAGVKNIFEEIKHANDTVKINGKSISGMTRLLEPVILSDFEAFNKEELFSKCENNLRSIFNAKEKREILDLEKYPLLYDNIKKEIDDMISDNIFESFNDIHFNSFAIKDYHKNDTEAIIDIVCSVGYDYQKKKKNKVIKDLDNYQTRYLCKFIYIIDETKFRLNDNVFSKTCPHCGAALRTLNKCSYCNATIMDINMRSWYMVSYKEY